MFNCFIRTLGGTFTPQEELHEELYTFKRTLRRTLSGTFTPLEEH